MEDYPFSYFVPQNIINEIRLLFDVHVDLLFKKRKYIEYFNIFTDNRTTIRFFRYYSLSLMQHHTSSNTKWWIQMIDLKQWWIQDFPQQGLPTL